jgi:hypothetical protein
LSINYIQNNYDKLDVDNLIKFLLDLTVVNLNNVAPYNENELYTKGSLVYLKEDNVHKVFRCKINMQNKIDAFILGTSILGIGKLIPKTNVSTDFNNIWEHILDIYDKKVETAGNIFIREEIIKVNENNLDNIFDQIIVSNYKQGSSIITIYIDKNIFINGRDFVIDENGKVTFTPNINVEIGDKIIIEIKDIIGQPNKLIILSSNNENYEIGIIGEDLHVIKSDLKYSKPEIFIRDTVTDENYRIFMIDEDVYFELTDISTVQTEIKVLDTDDNKFIIEMVDGELLLSPKE